MPKAYGSTNSFNESLPDSLDLNTQDHGTMGSKGIQNISIEQIFNDATNTNGTTDAPLPADVTKTLLTNQEITRTLKVYHNFEMRQQLIEDEISRRFLEQVRAEINARLQRSKSMETKWLPLCSKCLLYLVSFVRMSIISGQQKGGDGLLKVK
jgi:hypothetical protein